MLSRKILVLKPMPADIIAQISQYADVICLYDMADPGATLRENADHIEIVIGGADSHIGAKIIDMLPNLRLICLPLRAMGLLDHQACLARKIHIQPIEIMKPCDYAEMACAMLFGLSRRLIEINMIYRTGHWHSSSRRDGARLSGQHIAIFGDSRIQDLLSTSLNALGLNLIDKSQFSRLEDVAKKSDVFMLLPGCEGALSDKKITSDVLKSIGKEGYLIVISAEKPVQALINMTDLQIALENKQIAGAAIDCVFDGYHDIPDTSNQDGDDLDNQDLQRLFAMDNVIMMPGVAGVTQQASHEYAQQVVKSIAHYVDSLAP